MGGVAIEDLRGSKLLVRFDHRLDYFPVVGRVDIGCGQRFASIGQLDGLIRVGCPPYSLSQVSILGEGSLVLVNKRKHREYGTYKTVPVPADLEVIEDLPLPAGWVHALDTMWENGMLVRDWRFDEVRARSQII